MDREEQAKRQETSAEQIPGIGRVDRPAVNQRWINFNNDLVRHRSQRANAGLQWIRYEINMNWMWDSGTSMNFNYDCGSRPTQSAMQWRNQHLGQIWVVNPPTSYPDLLPTLRGQGQLHFQDRSIRWGWPRRAQKMSKGPVKIQELQNVCIACNAISKMNL